MKKLMVMFVVAVMVMALSVPAFAHPMVPDQSIGNVSVNAAKGLHNAAGNLAIDGVAYHVFMARHYPAGH